MDPNIEKLKARLAAGEISVGEYQELLTVITAPSGLGSASSGPASGSVPTLASPLAEVRNPEHGTITLYETAIVIRGARRDLADVVSVRRQGDSFSVNLVPLAKHTGVLIKFRDGFGIYISESRAYTSFGAHKALNDLGSLLVQKTSQARLNDLVSRLNRDGQVFLYKDDKDDRSVVLMRDGTVKRGDFSLNLKDAGSIAVGSEDIRLSGSRYFDADAITISREKLKESYAFGHGVPKERIEFAIVAEDKDVTLNLLAWLAKAGNHL